MDAVDRSQVILKGGRDTFVSAVGVGKGRYSERFLLSIDHALQFKEGDRPQTIGAWKSEFDLPEDPIKKAVIAERITTQPGTKVLGTRQQKVWLSGKVALLGLIISVAVTYFYWDGIQYYLGPTKVQLEVERQRIEEEKRLAALKQKEEEQKRVEAEAQRQAELERQKQEDARKQETERLALEEERRRVQEEEQKRTEVEAQHLTELERQRVEDEKNRLAEEAARRQIETERLNKERIKEQFDNGVAAYESGNYHEALNLFMSLAEQGDASAQYNLGFMYDNGKG
jgi:Membrane protein involved in colicin uptake